MDSQICIRIFLLCFITFLFVACLAISALANMEEFREIEMFHSTTGNVSDKYPLDITPANYAFSIWSAIFVLQALIIVYAFTTLCRKNSVGSVATNPGFIPISFLIVYVFNWGTYMTWMFMWDREYMLVAMIIIMTMALTLYICIGTVMNAIAKHSGQLIAQGQKVDIVLTQMVVLNGLATYATWVSLATLLNVAIVLAYDYDFSRTIASNIAVGGVAVDVVVFTCLDMIVFERHFRYLYAPYIVVIHALAAITHKNWDPDMPSSIFVVALLVCGVLLAVFKVIRSIYMTVKHPIYSASSAKQFEKV